MRLLRDPPRSRYQLCLSEYILTETAETLLGKSRLRDYAAYADTDVRDFIRWLLTHAEMIADLPTLRVVAGDHRRRRLDQKRARSDASLARCRIQSGALIATPTGADGLRG